MLAIDNLLIDLCSMTNIFFPSEQCSLCFFVIFIISPIHSSLNGFHHGLIIVIQYIGEFLCLATNTLTPGNSFWCQIIQWGSSIQVNLRLNPKEVWLRSIFDSTKYSNL